MKKQIKSLEEIIDIFKINKVPRQIIKRIPNSLLYNKMYHYGFSNKHIIEAHINTLKGIYGKDEDYRKYYYGAVEKIETIVELNVPVNEVNLLWFDRNVSLNYVERIILRRYSPKIRVYQRNNFILSTY